VIVATMDGNASLYGPALQLHYDEEAVSQRVFEQVLSNVSEEKVAEKLTSEAKFDPDIWVVEIEDPKNRCFIENLIENP